MCSFITINCFNLISILISFTSHIIAINTKGVPVLILGNERYLSEPIQLISHSLLDPISERTFQEDFIRKTIKSDVTLVTIIQNELSLEDFSTTNKNDLKSLDNILKSFSSYFLADVENPINAIVKNNDNITRIKSIDHLIVRPENKIVLIELPVNNGLKENDKLIGKIMNKLNETSNSKMIVMLTGKRSSYGEEETHRISRHILQNPSPKPKPVAGHLVEFNDCIFLFINGGTISLAVTKENSSNPDFTLSGELPVKPSSIKGSCPKFVEKENKDLGKLTLTYDNILNVGKFVITFSIEISKKWWKVSQVSTVITNKEKGRFDLQLDSRIIEAEQDFSFSCGDLVLIDSNNNDEKVLKVNYKRFQLQPFKSKSSQVFADSFDCTTFFTIPLWMGLISVLLFISMLLIGVYFLNEIKTMDRFENPKGKTITVAPTE